jgi:hypothetical protein
MFDVSAKRCDSVNRYIVPSKNQITILDSRFPAAVRFLNSGFAFRISELAADTAAATAKAGDCGPVTDAKQWPGSPSLVPIQENLRPSFFPVFLGS